MKTRFSSLDCAAAVSELAAELVGLRLANVYDINTKTYVLKLAKPDKKCMLLIESGVRLHTLPDYSRDKAHVPSVFALKLRKLLRTKRIEQVSQLGHDRIVSLAFGSGPARRYLVLEMFASGNIVVCDQQWAVEAVLRPHVYPDGTQLAVGSSSSTGGGTQQPQASPTAASAVPHRYPLHLVAQPVAVDAARLSAALAAARAAVPVPPLKQVLSELSTVGPILVEHVLLGLQAGPNPAASALRTADDERRLLDELKACEALLSAPPRAGFIVQRPATEPKPASGSRRKNKAAGMETAAGAVASTDGVAAIDADAGGAPPAEHQPQQSARPDERRDMQSTRGPAPPGDELLIFDDFAPVFLRQYDRLLSRASPPLGQLSGAEFFPSSVVRPTGNSPERFWGGRLLKFGSFMEAVSHYWGELDKQKVQKEQRQKEEAVLSKLRQLRDDQNRRVDALSEEQERNRKRGRLLEAHSDDVDACLASLRNALATGVDWRELEAMVKQARRAGDPLAALVHKLQLEKNRVTLALMPADSLDELAQGLPAVTIEVDLSLTSHANARAYFELAKQQQAKADKTAVAARQAVKRAEAKARQGLEEVRQQADQRARPQRRLYWFEKFHWFISSHNALVIGGRDAQQNEQLVKRYMRPTDIYVHADLGGAPSVLIKCPPGREPSVATLMEAGALSVCCSSAWQDKVVAAAWWVRPEQVSKTAPSGEYLTTGSFIIRGRKNFLPPCQLQMGFGFLFKLESGSIPRHHGERTFRDEPGELEHNEGSDLLRTEETASDDAGIANVFGLRLAVDESDDDATQEQALEPVVVRKPSRPGLSAFEKRQLRKQKKLDVPETSTSGPRMDAARTDAVDVADSVDSVPSPSAGMDRQQPAKVSSSISTVSASTVSAPKAAAPKAPVRKRGQAAKLKKQQQKYADQDEEERAQKMALLGSVPKAKAGAADSVDRRTSSRANSKVEVPVLTKKREPRTGAPKVLVADAAVVASTTAEASSDTQVLPTAESAVGKEEEAEAVRQLLASEDGDVAPDFLEEFDSLTGIPHPDDELLYAIPVCAPYAAMKTYKFKVKLQPGTLRKGKAAKLARALLERVPEMTPVEKKLIRAVDDLACTQALIMNCKVAAPGVTQLQTALRREKKTS